MSLNDSAPSTASGVLPPSSTKTTILPAHPLDPLSPDEISAVSLAVRHHLAANTSVKAVRFLTNYLLPPPKRAVLAHLGIPLATGETVKEEDRVPIVRKAEVDFIDVLSGDAYNAIAALDSAKSTWSIESILKLPEGTQPQISPGELLDCEEIVKNDPGVQKLAKEVGVEPHQIFADGWSIGYDDRFPVTFRLQQALLFARFSQHDNLYAHPLDFIPIVDMNAGKVIHIDFPGAYPSVPASTQPPPLDKDPLEYAQRSRIPPPLTSQDFLPDLITDAAKKEGKEWKQRETLKPLHIVQPEGVSFKVDGHVLEWQKWKMHVAFSHREGIALSTITYNDDGVLRPLFYRLSLAEMVVPYGAPEHPHPRKFAFDAGEYGMGTMANELSLGCDCLGQIHYLPGAYTNNDGSAAIIKNVICIHEEDAGLLWKHTDYRVGGRSYSVRSRRLVVSMVCTLANYEYVWNYFFYQDGSIEFEIRLTGILQVYVAGPNEPAPYATRVAPGINAHFHQHLFSVRIDPMVIETDVLPVAAEYGSPENFAGNAFQVHDRVLKRASEGAREWDASTDRRWRIASAGKKHYASGQLTGYSIGIKGGATPSLPRPEGWVGRRATFTHNTLWVVHEKEDAREGGRMWPSGKFVPQGREEPVDSLARWVRDDGDANIENEDVLVYVTIGTTHIPRPEDWPVMPVDHLRLTLKPNSFFSANPSLDVPGRKDEKSVLAFDADSTGRGESCCA
ncbi:peroxisomal copper amine oxidase [Multifurca ochricompacta]|uniref:Amine oxidase n=1 Tax=Multifurca ochricompacta TaxID=376703 RepID=A0AAD4M2X2_9AGAM|nr:peroxisomal copper amine oxidase [Multifurca ochricompacta]